MSDKQPLDLRSLGDVDSPEVVHEALTRFRKRTVTRYVWLALLAILLVAGIAWARTPTTLSDRIDRASSAVEPSRTWRLDGASIGVERVVDLGGGIGFRLEILPDPGRGFVDVRASNQIDALRAGRLTLYLEVAPPADGVVDLTVSYGHTSQRITVDLRTLRVPDSYWRG
jgi:hypothetical protein